MLCTMNKFAADQIQARGSVAGTRGSTSKLPWNDETVERHPRDWQWRVSTPCCVDRIAFTSFQMFNHFLFSPLQVN